MSCLGVALGVVGLVGFMVHQYDPYPWLQVPKGFYQPQMFSAVQFDNDRKLAALPAQYEDLALKHQLEDLLAQYPKNLKPHLYYLNLQDHSYVAFNAENPVAAASVIKLPILLEYLREVDSGEVGFNTPLLYQAFEQAAGSGELQYTPPGKIIPTYNVARQMIQISDNTCTNMLIYTMGGADHLNHMFEGMGLKHTYVANWLPDLTGTNMVSMHDTATILYNLYQGHGVSPTARQTAFEILTGTHNRRLLPALLPKDVVIAHKTGDIGTSLGNSGLIELPNGQKYIVAIQVERPYNDYTAKDLIQQVSKTIYDNIKDKNALASASTTETAVNR